LVFLLVWLLDLPGQLMPKWHPQLLLCEPDVDDNDDLCFVQMDGARELDEVVRLERRVSHVGIGGTFPGIHRLPGGC